MLRIERPGLLLTIQDRGRPGFGHLGVPPSGACDPWGYAAANVLADAAAGSPAIELTLGGAELLAEETCAISLGGADLGAERDDGTPLEPGATYRLPAGARIRFTGRPRMNGSASFAGARAYLALAGGIVADRVLGSASTLAIAGLGGLEGRALGTGDVLVPVRPGDLSAVGRRWPVDGAPHPATRGDPVGFVPGPDLRHLPPAIEDRLAGAAWTVSPSSDRAGLRLEGEPLAPGREILSHPVVPGSIQLPADGRPIIVFVDGPTIGGYPVIGVVARLDHARLSQLLPGDPLTFAPMNRTAARAAWHEQQERFGRVGRTLGADAIWDDLAGDARG